MKTRMVINSIGVLLILAVLVACEKEEIPVPAHIPGDGETNTIELGQYYENQLFFDLGTNTVVASNLKSAWDLSFESAEDGFHIFLNSAKGMAIHRSDLSFDAITSADDLVWKWDAHSGNIDSTAIGNWQLSDQLYVIDRGYDHTGTHLGYYKLKVNAFDATSYTILVGDISSSTGVEKVVMKDASRHLTYYHLETGTIEIAPKDELYDIVFTQYTYLFTEPEMPYLVSGVLLNRQNTLAIELKETDYNSVNLSDIIDLELSGELDAIGYEWKFYAYDEGVYLIDPDKVYIIKTADGLYYKLHFVGFYNESGLKGYPSIEIQQL
ncbi:HmuY family protein [Crocinitomix catalasitica]|uniref:HmuY family protein n=1 Tax=Crocinitomix catalasitica TaxID=184607 RepID=UPI000480F336|nr:HmuY family protein [Crocinitomix catalasitica]